MLYRSAPNELRSTTKPMKQTVDPLFQYANALATAVKTKAAAGS